MITALVATTLNSSTDPGGKHAGWQVEKRYGGPGIVPPHHATPPYQNQPHLTPRISSHANPVVRYDDDEEETMNRTYLTTSTFVKIYGVEEPTEGLALKEDSDGGEEEEGEYEEGMEGEEDDDEQMDECERGRNLLDLDLTSVGGEAVSNPGRARVDRPNGGIACKVCG